MSKTAPDAALELMATATAEDYKRDPTTLGQRQRVAAHFPVSRISTCAPKARSSACAMAARARRCCS